MQEGHERDDEALAKVLRQFQPPRPESGYFDRAVTLARQEALRRGESERRQSRSRVAGAAIAAALAMVVVGVLFLRPDAELPPGADRPDVTLELAEEKTVNLVFSSATALEDARLTLLLPPGVELAGFPGEDRVSWTTSLGAGRNLLPLTFVATSRAGGEVQARLEHDARARTYRLRLEIA